MRQRSFLNAGMFLISRTEYDICLLFRRTIPFKRSGKTSWIVKKKNTKSADHPNGCKFKSERTRIILKHLALDGHGMRFSHQYLLKMLERNGWNIQQTDRNEITWNKRLCDRGSSYVLCTPM